MGLLVTFSWIPCRSRTWKHWAKRQETKGVCSQFSISISRTRPSPSPIIIGKSSSYRWLFMYHFQEQYTFTIRKTRGLQNIRTDDYQPVDPSPSSKATIRPGPIEHGTPLLPYVPRYPPPPPASCWIPLIPFHFETPKIIQIWYQDCYTPMWSKSVVMLLLRFTCVPCTHNSLKCKCVTILLECCMLYSVSWSDE